VAGSKDYKQVRSMVQAEGRHDQSSGSMNGDALVKGDTMTIPSIGRNLRPSVRNKWQVLRKAVLGIVNGSAVENPLHFLKILVYIAEDIDNRWMLRSKGYSCWMSADMESMRCGDTVP
jgi:hypothetical protein